MRHPIVTEDMRQIADTVGSLAAFDGATVVISGAGGFVPAYLVEALLFAGEAGLARVKVVGLVRDREKAAARFAHHAGRAELELVTQDLAEPLRYDGPADFIIHAASHASPKHFGGDPVGTLGPNVLGTRELLELARRRKSKGFIFFSSAEIYGEVAPEAMPVSERTLGLVDPLEIRSCYAESKRMGETMCVSWHAQWGVPARIVRPFHTYGPGISFSDGRVFSDFVADLVSGRDIVMRSRGDARRAFCYLGDLTTGVLRVILNGADGQAYNIGNAGAEASILELARRLVALFPEKRLKVVEVQERSVPGYLETRVNRIVPDTGKLEALGWRPCHSIESGFKRTVESFS